MRAPLRSITISLRPSSMAEIGDILRASKPKDFEHLAADPVSIASEGSHGVDGIL